MAQYEKRESGKWSVRFKETLPGQQPKYKRLSGFATKKEAQYAYEDYIANREANPPTAPVQASAPEIKTFGDLAEKFLAYKKPRVKYSSYYEFERRLSRHVLPAFGERRVQDIRPIEIANWQQKMLESYSWQHMNTVSQTMTAVFRFGAKFYDLPNPTEKVEKPRRIAQKREMQVWSLDEFNRFLQAVEGARDRALFFFLYTTGCRGGECRALEWRNVDLTARTAYICQSVTNKSGTGSMQITTPKNQSSVRRIPLTERCCDLLSALADEQERNGKKLRFVFSGEDPISENTIMRLLDLYSDQSGVKKIRVHDLRHSCASYLISHGVNIVAVSRLLGHSTVTQTLNTYSHIMPEDTDKLVSALSEI